MLRISAVAIVLVVLISPFLAGQTTSTFMLKRSTISGGGGSATAGGYTLNGTVSQSAIGKTASPEYAHGVGFWYTVIGRVTTSAGPLPVSADFSLEQNYPNPFTESTNIPYTVRTGGRYVLSLHSIDGRTSAILEDSEHTPGSYEIKFHPRGLKPGVFILRLSGTKLNLQRMIVFIGN